MADKKIKMIVLEGFDRTGKDTLMNMIEVDDELNKQFVCYHQPSIENEHVDYKDPEAFKEFMLKHTRELLNELYSLAKTNGGKTIVVSRMWLTDDVFSDLYNREHVFRKYFLKELQTNFHVYNYILLFKSYDEYVKRCEMIGENPAFTQEEFDRIIHLFSTFGYANNLEKNNYDMRIELNATDTKEELLEDFRSHFFEFDSNTEWFIDKKQYKSTLSGTGYNK